MKTLNSQKQGPKEETQAHLENYLKLGSDIFMAGPIHLSKFSAGTTITMQSVTRKDDDKALRRTKIIVKNRQR